MILVNHYAIWPLIPKTIFIKQCWVEIIAFPFRSFTAIVFSMSATFSVSNSLLHIYLKSHNVLILLSLSGVTNLSLFIGVCAACMLAYKCQWSAVTHVAIPSQKALLMCPYVSSGKFSVHAPCCSRALLHNLQPTSDRCLILASHLAIGIIPTNATICRQGVSSKSAGHSNTSLRMLCFHFAVT